MMTMMMIIIRKETIGKYNKNKKFALTILFNKYWGKDSLFDDNYTLLRVQLGLNGSATWYMTTRKACICDSLQ